MSVLIQAIDVCKEFSGERLFEPLSFIVRDHDRVAVIGPNGTGKSTLIKMIIGEEECTQGTIQIPKNVSIGYLSQDVIEDGNNTLYQEAESVFKDLKEEEKILEKLSQEISENPDDEKKLLNYSNRQISFEEKGGYNYKYKIVSVLNMFSFTKDDYDRKIDSFSGGEKTRLAFAKLILKEPDV